MARYFITGGGTGGHIYPAIAVADLIVAKQLSSQAAKKSEEQRAGGQEGKPVNNSNACEVHQEQKVDKDLSLYRPIVLSPDNSQTSYSPTLLPSEIYYVGNPQNLEYDIVKQKGYKFLPVNIHGMPRKLSFSLLKWLFQLDIAVFKCCYYILKYKPDAVFGTGGYVSAPALIAAKLLNIPYMMHDCDAQPGLVTRHLAPYASSVSVAFEPACKLLNNKNCYVNGNPIRSEFKTISKEDARKNLEIENKLTLCIMGGSQGAKSINNSAVNILEKLSKEFDLQIIFQTGKKNYESVIEQLLKVYPEYEQDKNLMVKPYFDNMVTVLKASDIAVSRSGSLSISEICASKIAPIFVPYPHAAADHQRKNAKFMVEKGAGLYIDDNDINSKILYETIETLIKDENKLKEIQTNAFSLAHLDGTEKIVEQLKNITDKHRT
ncbi:undecaprenyldiphospho-muramoylpentapeptide beta-N-acetylglucosaminyltransferase [bacterium]|nr:undecaprenyldiphospho-muramoylpentapeptide beta-N-acetylglucosaminyltransferase [bacterium]